MILFRIYVTRAQDKTKQYYCCSFFSYFIQLCDSRKIHYLTREFRVKLHLETYIGFRVQFNVEFPRQVMNFPIISIKTKHVLNYIFPRGVDMILFNFFFGQGFSVNQIIGSRKVAVKTTHEKWYYCLVTVIRPHLQGSAGLTGKAILRGWYHRYFLTNKEVCDKTRRAFENTREMFSTFLECFQMSGVFYYSVINGLGYFICFMI